VSVVSFKYDAFGRRIYKSSTGSTSVFAYDGDNLIEDTNSNGTTMARYAVGLNIDEPLAILQGSTTDYYQADGLGSVTSLSNSSGASAQTYAYDSFGNLTASSGSLTNRYRYTGRDFDTETGLYYYRARYYDPTSARFLSEDLIHFRGAMNFYPYVHNNPTAMSDPKGLEASSSCPSKTPIKDFICHPLTAPWVLGAAGFGTMGTTALATAGGSGEGGAILTVLGGSGAAEGLVAISATAVPAVGAGLLVLGVVWAFYCW
jgi:RHS repeat-associated protein